MLFILGAFDRILRAWSCVTCERQPHDPGDLPGSSYLIQLGLQLSNAHVHHLQGRPERGTERTESGDVYTAVRADVSAKCTHTDAHTHSPEPRRVLETLLQLSRERHGEYRAEYRAESGILSGRERDTSGQPDKKGEGK